MNKFMAILLSLASLALAACSTSNGGVQLEFVDGEAALSPSESVTNSAALFETIDQLRGQGRLAESRSVALAALAQHPGDGEILWRASRAESDAVYVFQEEDPEVRDHAAAHALELAEAALACGAESLEARAQYAWAMGNATHLQPMFSRSGHARATRNAVEVVLKEDMGEPTALATAALLQYRLATLPTVLKVMAFTAPRGNLARAERFAQAAFNVEPSRLNALILAKVLVARDHPDVAADLLRQVLQRAESYPRDSEVTPELHALLARCTS